MKSYIIKMTFVVLIIGTLIYSFKDNKNVVFTSSYENLFALKSNNYRGRILVYEDMTLEELGIKIDKELNSTLSGYGETLASVAIENNVDPVIAASIVLLETGCKWNCSTLVNYCNNIGGMRGNGCNGYASFNTLEEGINAFISNLSYNYFALGLTTPETIGPKYAEDPNWSKKVNNYIEAIKNN